VTVCIAAICADLSGTPARAVVVASDRMVTFGGFYEFEHEVPKLSLIGGRVATLIAGDALKGAQIVQNVSGNSLVSMQGVSQIAEAISTEYVRLRQELVIAQTLLPRSLTVQTYYDQHGKLNPQIVFAIDNHMVQTDFGVQMLIAGIDATGAHLYMIANPGSPPNDFQQIGFASIGSGAIHASPALIGFGHAPFRSLPETVFAIYASKRRGELAPGVGKDTDLVIIREDGYQRLDATELASLEELYREYQQQISTELRDKIGQLSLGKKENDDDAATKE